MSQTGTFGTAGASEFYLANGQNIAGGKRTGKAGTGNSGNLQPYTSVNWIIKF